MCELNSYIEIMRLKNKVLDLYDKKLKQEDPRNKKFINENLQMKLEYKYNKYIHIRNKILFTNDKKTLNLILKDLL